MNRRDFLIGSSILLASSALATSGCISQRKAPLLVSTASDFKRNHYVVATTLDGAIVSKTKLPQRGHDTMAVPGKSNTVLVVARRPDRFAAEIDVINGQITRLFESQPGRHFYGHGCFSKSGDVLFTAENEYEKGRGIIVVRDASNYQVIGEFSSGGIGPHDMHLMPGGDAIAIANGGIITHPDMQRIKLNINTMQPNLSVVELATGTVLRTHQPPHHKQSIRHIDVADNGEIFVGVQWQGADDNVLPLVYRQRDEQALSPFNAEHTDWRAMRQYTASVKVNKNRLVVTCPRGDCVTIWDLERNALAHRGNLNDAAGVAVLNDDFMISSGAGELHRTYGEKLIAHAKAPDIRLDNHMMTLSS